VAAISLALTLAAAYAVTKPHPDSHPDGGTKPDNFPLQAIALGLAGTVFGVLPVIMANRFVIFKAYSHYALPASLAGVIFIVGLIHIIPTKKLPVILVALLVSIAALTHRGVALKAAEEQAKIRAFWWQVYWRAPQIQGGTMLAVLYPSINIGEDIETISGPANFLYYPEPETGTDIVKYQLGATLFNKQGFENILGEQTKISRLYRSHTMFLNYRKTLVLNQPTVRSCVHVIDSHWVEQSRQDKKEIVQLFPHSKVESVSSVDEVPKPLSFVFGAEPPHGWCYFYQKAELARQLGDWDSVAALGAEAASRNLVPADPIEWMPFLQAYAVLGESAKMESIAAQFKDDPFHKAQFCQSLNRMEENRYPLKEEMQGKVSELFCK
jgi:hypothetical protein